MRRHKVMCEAEQERLAYDKEMRDRLALAIAHLDAEDSNDDSDTAMGEDPDAQMVQHEDPPEQEMEENDFGGGEEAAVPARPKYASGQSSARQEPELFSHLHALLDVPSPHAISVEHPTMGKLLFERHPDAGDNSLPSPAPPGEQPPRPRRSTPSFSPYPSRSDYLVGAFAVSAGLSFGNIDKLYKLLRHKKLVLKDIKHKNSGDIRAVLGLMDPLGGEMKTSKIQVPFNGVDEEVEVRHIDIMSVIRTVVGSPELAPHLKLYPERWFRDVEGKEPERIIDEFMTADDAWDYFKDHGDWGKHGLPLLVLIAGDDGAELLDRRAKAIASWPDLHQFNTNGISKPTFADGNWYRDILRFLPGILEDVFPEEDQEVVEHFIRATAVHRLFQGLDVHTPTKLLEMETWIEKIELTYKAIARKYGKDLNYPKREADRHTASVCREKGATIGTSTKEGESLHPRHHTAFQLTNGKTWMGQMIERMSMEDKQLVIEGCIRRDPVESRETLNMLSPETYDTRSTDLARFRFHAETQPVGYELLSGKPPLELDEWLLAPHRVGDPQFNDFESGLRFFLHTEVDNQPSTNRLNATRQLNSRTLISPFQPLLFQVTEWRALKVTYSSLDDYRTDFDRLIINPSFHGKKREDGVMVLGVDDVSPWFYRLLAILTIERDGETLELAYGRPYTVTGRHQSHQSILADLAPSALSDFFWVSSIIRGVHVYSQGREDTTKFIINDLIDADSYFRLQHLHPIVDTAYWDALRIETRVQDRRIAQEREERLAAEAATRERKAAEKKEKAENARTRKRARNAKNRRDREESAEDSAAEDVADELDPDEQAEANELDEDFQRSEALIAADRENAIRAGEVEGIDGAMGDLGLS
ncbi:hypothetical protein P7C70_g1064, partial [Phenoliferia sp. Uapishka_3]